MVVRIIHTLAGAIDMNTRKNFFKWSMAIALALLLCCENTRAAAGKGGGGGGRGGVGNGSGGGGGGGNGKDGNGEKEALMRWFTSVEDATASVTKGSLPIMVCISRVGNAADVKAQEKIGSWPSV